jgi:hypothetical protein
MLSRWGFWNRQRAGQDVTGLIHHSDRGQYRAIRYAERLAEAKAVASVASKGDSYDNAMAEAFNSLFKAECIRNPVMQPKGGWRSVVDVELAVAEYVDWFNYRRIHGEIGQLPPAEFEANHRARQIAEPYSPTRAPSGSGSEARELSLYRSRGDSPGRAGAVSLPRPKPPLGPEPGSRPS